MTPSLHSSYLGALQAQHNSGINEEKNKISLFFLSVLFR